MLLCLDGCEAYITGEAVDRHGIGAALGLDRSVCKRPGDRKEQRGVTAVCVLYSE
jgi:hypothetical protein